MSDIVERLMEEQVEDRHGMSAVLLGQLLGEAADEIERLRAELDAQRARADENELCAAAVVEIRRLCKEIMGGNLSFVDDDFARCLLTLRAERDALAAENSAFGKAMQKVRPLTDEECDDLLTKFERGGLGYFKVRPWYEKIMAARGIEVGE